MGLLIFPNKIIHLLRHLKIAFVQLRKRVYVLSCGQFSMKKQWRLKSFFTFNRIAFTHADFLFLYSKIYKLEAIHDEIQQIVSSTAAECGDPQTHRMIVSLLLMPASARSLLSAKYFFRVRIYRINVRVIKHLWTCFEWKGAREKCSKHGYSFLKELQVVNKATCFHKYFISNIKLPQVFFLRQSCCFRNWSVNERTTRNVYQQ